MADRHGSHASSGMETPWQRHMVERFTQVGDELLAVLSNGSVISSPIESFNWKEIFPEANGAAAVTEMHE